MGKAGHVYILSNPAMPGLVKIGLTTKAVSGRAKELYTTGVPAAFVVEHSYHTSDTKAAEEAAHEALEAYRYNGSREFFEVSPEHAQTAIEAMMKARGEKFATLAQAQAKAAAKKAAKDAAFEQRRDNRKRIEDEIAAGTANREDTLAILKFTKEMYHKHFNYSDWRARRGLPQSDTCNRYGDRMQAAEEHIKVLDRQERDAEEARIQAARDPAEVAAELAERARWQRQRKINEFFWNVGGLIFGSAFLYFIFVFMPEHF